MRLIPGLPCLAVIGDTYLDFRFTAKISRIHRKSAAAADLFVKLGFV